MIRRWFGADLAILIEGLGIRSALLVTCLVSIAACGHTKAAASRITEMPAGSQGIDAVKRLTSGTSLDIYCSGAGDSLVIGGQKEAVGTPGETRQRIDTNDLVIYEQRAGQAVKRVGTKEIESVCGALVVSISGGFYNEDPEGELGAADDYAVVLVHSNRRRVAGPIAIGVCLEGNPRYETIAACPAGWATRVEVRVSEDGYLVHLKQGQDE